MNLQQSMQPKSSANGFGRRRVERDWGTRFENKVQSGKSHINRSINAGAIGKIGVHESPSRDRLVYLTTCLIGHTVEVQLKNGSIYSGTCYTTNVEKEFAIILKMARLTTDVAFRGQKAEHVSKAPSKTLILPGKEVVQVIAKVTRIEMEKTAFGRLAKCCSEQVQDVSVTMDGMSNELQHAKQQEIMIDSFISQLRHVEVERELEPWVPEEDDPQYPELENIFDGHWNSRGWDQFETNEMLFGVKSTFDEELYTTKLERGPQMKELERDAVRIAREIEGEETRDLHLAEERGIHLHESFDIDEETRFSSVHRGRANDDGAYEELDDIVMNSHNNETFGGASSSSIKKSADLTNPEKNDRARVSSSSSLDEAQCSQPSTGADPNHPGLNDLAAQLESEPPKSFSTTDSESRVLENLHHEQGELASIKEPAEEQMPTLDIQLPKSEDSKSLDGKKSESDKGRLSPNTTAYAAPSHGFPKKYETISSPVQLSESALSARGAGETQPVNTHQLPGSSTSSNSDCVGAVLVSSGPGLSPSSSVGSLSSEKSSLNPHAKEFKLNPNAKSFTPSQVPTRPPSPMSDGSFYFQPNASALQHVPTMPMGIGLGHSFTGQQPVIFNPQVTPLQAQQAYFHPAGPQFGQQMLLGHPRQVLYMPSYQPEMQYKGREF